jgi:hypothetical protein
VFARKVIFNVKPASILEMNQNVWPVGSTTQILKLANITTSDMKIFRPDNTDEAGWK